MTDTSREAALARHVLREQLRAIIAQTPQGLAGPAALATISAVLVWDLAPRPALEVSLGLLALALGWWLRLYLKFRREGIDEARAEVWLQQATLRTFAHGACWGLYSWVIFSPDSLTYQALDVAFMYGLVAGAVVVDGPLFRVFAVFALPTLGPVVLRCFLQGTPTSIGIGVAGLVGLTHGLFAAASSARVASSAIRARFDADQARSQAEAANQAKSRFLAAASHDLRQPVHALSLFTEALRRARNESERQEVLERIEASVAALSASFDSLLEISRLDAGVLRSQPEVVALGPLLRRLSAELAPVAEAKQLRFACHQRELAVVTDPVLLERILRNLLENALRYTSRGGVLLAVRRRAGRARLEVWDTGPGIAPEHQAGVFEEFFQLGNPERDRKQGVGLGLAIVRRTAALLEHPLELVSAVGRGTRVSLELPLSATAPALQAVVLESTPALETALMGSVIAVIDDDAEARAGTQLVLQQHGSQVVAAESSVQALERLELAGLVPDLILSDYRLRAGHSGIAAIAALRARYGQDLPAVLVTGDTASEQLVDVAHSGLVVLHKPVSPSRLTRALSEQLG